MNVIELILTIKTRLMYIYRALVDPQKKDLLDPDPDPNLSKDLRSDHDPPKDPFNNSQRTIIFSTAL